MSKEIIKETTDHVYGCSKCIYSKQDDVSCLRKGGCHTEKPNEYYVLVDDKLKEKQ